MGRLWIGIGLMTVLLALGLYGATAMDGVHSPIADQLEQAAAMQDPDAAARALQAAKSAWDQHWHRTAVLAEHEPMDDIDSLFAQAESYASSNQMGDFSAMCMRLSQRIRAAAESHRPTWWNFL